MTSDNPPPVNFSTDDARRELVRRAMTDRGAMNELIRTFRPFVSALCRRYTHNAADAEDLEQEVGVTFGRLGRQRAALLERRPERERQRGEERECLGHPRSLSVRVDAAGLNRRTTASHRRARPIASSSCRRSRRSRA